MVILEKAFISILQTSINVSIAIIGIALIIKLFDKHISVRIKYVLWVLVIVRLFVPVVPKIDFDIVSLMGSSYQNDIVDTQETVSDESTNINNMNLINENIDIVQARDSNDVSESQTVSKEMFFSKFLKVTSCIWFIGIISLSLIFVVTLMKFKNKKMKLVNTNESLQDLKNKLIKALNLKNNIQIYVCDDINSPCILGIVKPSIYIPKEVLEIENSMNDILLHELIHYKRKDPLLNFLSVIALSIHWFNPLVWLAFNQMKIYREYACDAYLLEVIGEEKNIEYGMTLINYSKQFLNSTYKYSKLAICFETNNEIKGRIKMIKGFKKGTYKMSKRAVLGCLIAATMVFTNGASVRALDSNNVLASSSENQVVNIQNSNFLVDSKIKSYDNMNKVKKIAGFDFKLPDYIAVGNKPTSYQVHKITDNSDAVVIFFDNKSDMNENNFTLIISKDDPEKVINKINENHGALRDNSVDMDNQEMKIGKITGRNITFTINIPEETRGNMTFKKSHHTEKNFVWEDNEVYYAIQYGESYGDEEKEKVITDIKQDELEKMITSFKELSEIKNVDYKTNSQSEQELSTELGIMMIYDKEDLKDAQNILGYNPKMLLKVNDNMKLTQCAVGITGDSDTENNKINYEMNSIYNNDGEHITFTQSNHDTSEKFNDIKKNGYVIVENYENETKEKVNVEKVNISGKDVFRYKETYNEENTDVVYLWEEDGVYYSVVLFDKDEYQDDIIEKFVNAEPIE